MIRLADSEKKTEGRGSEKSRRCQIFTSTCSPFFPPRRGLASSGRYAGPYEPRVGVPYRPGNLFSLLSSTTLSSSSFPFRGPRPLRCQRRERWKWKIRPLSGPRLLRNPVSSRPPPCLADFFVTVIYLSHADTYVRGVCKTRGRISTRRYGRVCKESSSRLTSENALSKGSTELSCLSSLRFLTNVFNVS